MNNDVSELYDLAERQHIPVDRLSLRQCPSLSLCLEGRCFIALDPEQLSSAADERVKLAHELGHCRTASFYNRASPADLRARHEERADRWAIRALVPREELERAVARGFTQPWELAEYFQVTQPFMEKAIAYYQMLSGEE